MERARPSSTSSSERAPLAALAALALAGFGAMCVLGARLPPDVKADVRFWRAAARLDDTWRLMYRDGHYAFYWDYGGFNSPLFDLANAASNNEFPDDLVERLLALYFGKSADEALMRRYHAMACASLLRETMWSMVSEIHSTLDFDYVAYTEENLARFERACAAFDERF